MASCGRGVMWTGLHPENPCLGLCLNPEAISHPLAFPPALALGIGRTCSR